MVTSNININSRSQETKSNDYDNFKGKSFDFLFQAPEGLIEQIEKNRSERIIVVCMNSADTQPCTSLLNARTSVRFTSIDNVPLTLSPCNIDHLIIDFNRMYMMGKDFKPYDTFIVCK